jgi:hypothetical protein
MEEVLEKRHLKIYCPEHYITFEIEESPKVICEHRGHALSNNFPNEEFWEYCCDCQTFSPSDLEVGGKAKDTCRQCERTTIQRFVCNECKIVAFDSSEETKGKIYEVHPIQGIKPNCPGCQKLFVDQKFQQHICSTIGTNLLTARERCPFCKKNILAIQSKQTEISKTFEPVLPPSGTIKCPKCSSHNPKDTFFCGKCGQSFENVTSSETLLLPSQRSLTRNQVQPTTQSSPLPTGINVSGKPKLLLHQPVIIGLVVIGIISVIAVFVVSRKNQSVGYNSASNLDRNSAEVSRDNSFSNTLMPSTDSPGGTLNSEPLASVRQEVSDALFRWKSDAEALNFSAYINNYADTVDYYRAGKSDRSRVSKDKQRTFQVYDSIQITLNIIRITPSSEGNKATVIVDKSWNFKGAEKSTEGKVQQQLALAKINARWYITGEKDLEVYYTKSY